MTSQNNTIPCPTCSTKIPFDIQQLLMGAKFVCPNCQGAISLMPESKDVVKKTMNKFNELKQDIAQMKQNK